ncbi:GlsB/YeaQ/YmgE family stress response membrane protein [Pseudidiomarina salilacus]|uniref:GlsB/YeaQ/YmgE family stress response membrane protein n=1 Tax=Pseudidiomarina salilacus TaxID=3384452 RepID=UPI0039855CC7
MSFLWFLLVGLVAGWLAGTLVKGGGFGILGNIVIGIIGAMLGGFLFDLLGVNSGGGIIWSIVVATIGAVVLLVIVRALKKA